MCIHTHAQPGSFFDLDSPLWHMQRYFHVPFWELGTGEHAHSCLTFGTSQRPLLQLSYLLIYFWWPRQKWAASFLLGLLKKKKKNALDMLF